MLFQKIKFVIILLCLTVLKDAVSNISLKENPIYHAITILNPILDSNQAYHYSNIFAKYSKKYKINPFLVVAIARQESGIVLDTEGGDFEGTVYLNDIGNFVRDYEISDFCMMQIHKSNVKKLNLDPNKLLSDPDYCIHEGMKILYNFKYYQGIEPHLWWTRYNASSYEKRLEYRDDVLRHYLKLKERIRSFQEIIESYTEKEYFDFTRITDQGMKTDA